MEKSMEVSHSWIPYCKFRFKLKRVGKTTRPFRYDLNQIPYDYTVEVTNRFKGTVTNSSRKNEVAEPKLKECSVVDVSADESKIWCCEEQYCIGTWNVRSMNQGKLDVVKQEMARVNIDILGISELKWTGMGKFNWGDIILISTTAGKKLLEEMEYPS